MEIAKTIIITLFSLALFINALLFIPQALKIYREKLAADISLSTFIGFLFIQLTAVLYGFITYDYVLVIGYLLSMITCGTVVALTLRYQNRQGNKPLKEADNNLEEIIAIMPGNVYWVDSDSVYRGCNDNQAKSSGLSSRHEIVGKRNAELPWNFEAGTLPEDLDRVNLEVMRAGKSIVVEEPGTLADGTQLMYLSTKVPLRNQKNDVVGMVGISLDITDRKKMEYELKSAKEKAEAANEAKTEFLANMRHDIRTPLSGIVGFSELLKSESKEPLIKEYADNLMASSHALLKLMDDVLEAVRVSSGEIPMFKRKFQLKQVFEQIVSLYAAKAGEKHLKLSLDFDSELPSFVLGDKIRLHRIILELVGNALNFTDQGHVRITVALTKRQDRNLVIKIIISDTGMGIPKDKQQDIYLQFKRLTPSYQGIYKGAGLGLYVVKQFIDELDGEIYVESESHLGSSFTCLIPLKEALLEDDSGVESDEDLKIENQYLTPLSQMKTPDSELLVKSKSGIQVLVVEDNPIAWKVAQSILSALSCQVDVATSGDEALAFCKKNTYDLIFMDIGLGSGMDGYDVTHHIRSHHETMKDTPIVALTAHGADENKQRCIKAGMNAVLTKPLTQAMAADTLKAFVEEKKPMKPAVLKPGRRDLPDTDEEMFQLEQFALLDEAQGLTNCGNMETLTELLTMMTDAQIPEDLQHMKQAFEAQDFSRVEQLAHKMKGGAVYVGTTRMKYACQYLERYWKTGERELFEKLYFQAIKTIADTQVSILEYLKSEI